MDLLSTKHFRPRSTRPGPFPYPETRSAATHKKRPRTNGVGLTASHRRANPHLDRPTGHTHLSAPRNGPRSDNHVPAAPY